MYIRKHLSLVRISSMTRQGSSLEPARMHSHERFVKDFSEGIIFENWDFLGHSSRYDSVSPGRVLFTWSSWNLLFQHNIWSYHLWFRILDLIDLLGSICNDFFLMFLFYLYIRSPRNRKRRPNCFWLKDLNWIVL